MVLCPIYTAHFNFYLNYHHVTRDSRSGKNRGQSLWRGQGRQYTFCQDIEPIRGWLHKYVAERYIKNISVRAAHLPKNPSF